MQVIHTYTHIHACIHTYIRTYAYTYIYMYMHICNYTFTHIYIYTYHIYIYTYTHIHIFTSSHFHIFSGSAEPWTSRTWISSQGTTSSEDGLVPCSKCLFSLLMLSWLSVCRLAPMTGYDHHAIFVQWANAPDAYVIHHPVGKRTNPRRPQSGAGCSHGNHVANLHIRGCEGRYDMRYVMCLSIALSKDPRTQPRTQLLMTSSRSFLWN